VTAGGAIADLHMIHPANRQMAVSKMAVSQWRVANLLKSHGARRSKMIAKEQAELAEVRTRCAVANPPNPFTTAMRNRIKRQRPWARNGSPDSIREAGANQDRANFAQRRRR